MFTKVSNYVYWVGVQDPELRVFDIIMETPYGSSYNAYLVQGTEKIALIDTVKEKFFDEYLANIRALVDLDRVDHLIILHAEPDHAGSVERLLGICPNLNIVASGNTLEFLHEVCNRDFNQTVLGKGLELELGGKTLKFISALLLHWPDNIYTYLKEDKILFSGDSFGSHYSSPELFNDLISNDFSDAYKHYYDSIMSPFKYYVRRALEKLTNFNIDMICPGHGPILRTNIKHYIDLYRQWSQEKPEPESRPKIVMAYVSAYGYTKMLADRIEKGILDSGLCRLVRFDLLENGLEDVVNELESASGLLLGSPTINKDALLPVWDLLSRLSPVEHGGKASAAFGSYGWSGEAVPNLETRLRMLRMKIMPGLRVRFKPGTDVLEKAEQWGRDFARAANGEEDLLQSNLEYQISINPNNTFSFDRRNYIKTYENKDLVVYWNPHQCTHDTNCFYSLGSVFNPEARPWVDINGGEPVKIIRTIDNCPSGALKYSLPEGSSVPAELARGPGWIEYRKCQ